jgi:hypothetical protein
MLDNKDFKLSQHRIGLEKAITVHWFHDIGVRQCPSFFGPVVFRIGLRDHGSFNSSLLTHFQP